MIWNWMMFDLFTNKYIQYLKHSDTNSDSNKIRNKKWVKYLNKINENLVRQNPFDNTNIEDNFNPYNCTNILNYLNGEEEKK